MIAAAACALIVLAAGRSQRFGAADKLMQEYRGLALGLHVAATLAEVPFGARVAVCGKSDPGFADRGYAVVTNPDPTRGMAGSLKLGIAAAQAAGCAAAVIVLADMPCVSAALVRRLLEVADGAEAVVASSDGVQSSPPALIGAGHFATLLALEGDAGARALIRGGWHVIAGDGELLDVDRPGDLERLRGLGQSGMTPR